MSDKTVSNTSAATAKQNVKDIQFWGDGDTWKLISKAWSKEEEWMKSTKAMEIPGWGCCVQVSSQQEEMIAESVTFVPGVTIFEETNDDGVIIGRRLVKIEK